MMGGVVFNALMPLFSPFWNIYFPQLDLIMILHEILECY